MKQKSSDNSIDLTNANVRDYLCVRDAEGATNSNLRNKAFYLTDSFRWELKKDNRGVLCLVPTKLD